MKIAKVMLVISSVALLMPLNSQADEEFHGIIEKIPEGKIGTWHIGGRQVAVTASTELDEEHGPLVVGVCAEVEYKGDVVEEIESEDKYKCNK